MKSKPDYISAFSELLVSPDSTKDSSKISSNVNFNLEIDEIIEGTKDISQSYQLMNILERSANRYESYDEFREMKKDPLIGSVLELYADDASALTPLSITIETDNENVKDILEKYFNELEITKSLWVWSYNLAMYGDIYLERFYDSDGKLLSKVAMYPRPENLIDLSLGNETALFLERADLTNNEYYGMNYVFKDYQTMQSAMYDGKLGDVSINDRYLIHPNDKFVHGSVTTTDPAERILLEEYIDNNEDKAILNAYEIVKGESILDNVRYIYRLIKMIEQALFMARLSNSSRVDIFNVNVAPSADNDDTPESIARRYKNKILKEMKLSLDDGFTLSKGAPSINSVIVNPIVDDKGRLEHTEVESHIDINNLSDLDYFTNKFFAGVRVPKPLLGWEEVLGSSIGEGPMGILERRYARSVMRIVTALESMLTTLGKLYLEDCGIKSSGNVSVVVNAIVKESSTNYYDNQSKKIESYNELVDTIMTKILNSESNPGQQLMVLEVYKDLIPINSYNYLRQELITRSKNSEILFNRDSTASIIQDLLTTMASHPYEVKLIILDSVKDNISQGYYERIKELLSTVTSDESDDDDGNGGEEGWSNQNT